MEYERAPEALREAHASWVRTLHWDYPSVSTYRLAHADGRVRFLKLIDASSFPRGEDEAARMRWAARYLPVPEVLEAGTDGEVDWLLTAALAGRDATDPSYLADPERIAGLLGESLRRFHEAPVEDCPYDSRLDALLALARDRTERGVAGPLHTEFEHLTFEAGLTILERERPTEERLVVCHGDYCFPNVLFEAWELRGFVDLGELGVADRWWDLAVGSWSTIWNIGTGWEETFLRAYGVEADADRIRYYRLLYDYVS